MKIIDLTHTIKEDMPVYPGTDTPKLIPANSYEKEGFKETLLQMYTHTGTHTVSYTHLDVYKRQAVKRRRCFLKWAAQAY